MLVSKSNLKVTKVSKKEGSEVAGKTVEFLVIKATDEGYNRSFWCFSDAIAEPKEGDLIDVSFFISPKVSRNGKPYLSLQIKALEVK